MSSYRATADAPDRAKAIAAVLAVHALLAAIILSGLNVRVVRRAVEQLTTIDIHEPPPPPPVAPRPEPHSQQAKNAPGTPAPEAEPTPVVAPRSRLPLPSPVPAARAADSGAASMSGASASGSAGNETGGGGAADYSRFTPARLVRNLTRGDYRSLTAGRLPSGRAMVSLRVEPSGLPSNCQVLRSSGDPVVDAGLCPLIEARLRFRPALDDRGQPIAYRLDYVATWSL